MQSDIQYNLGLDGDDLKRIYHALRGGSFSDEYHRSMSQLATELEFHFPHLATP